MTTPAPRHGPTRLHFVSRTPSARPPGAHFGVDIAEPLGRPRAEATGPAQATVRPDRPGVRRRALTRRAGRPGRLSDTDEPAGPRLPDKPAGPPDAGRPSFPVEPDLAGADQPAGAAVPGIGVEEPRVPATGALPSEAVLWPRKADPAGRATHLRPPPHASSPPAPPQCVHKPVTARGSGSESDPGRVPPPTAPCRPASRPAPT